MRILYLEDEKADADLVRRRLEAVDPGIEIEIVGTLAGAIGRLDDHEAAIGRGEGPRYDILLLDMLLPDGNGMEILTRVRGRSYPLAVVVLTGSGDEQAALSALRAGANDYLVKRPGYWEKLHVTLLAALRSLKSTASLRVRPLRLLYVEHNAPDVEFTRLHLAEHAPFIQFESVAGASEALERLSRQDHGAGIDVLLADFRMPSMDALDLLKEINHARGLDVPIIVVTGQGSEDIAIQAMNLGAMDYIVKSDGYLQRLPLAVERAFYLRMAERERAALKASEAHLRTIIETEPECVKTVSRAGRLLEMNAAGLRMLEAESLAEVQARPLLDFIAPEYRTAFRDLHERVLDGESGTLTFEVIGLKGGRRWLETHATPIVGPSGGIEVFLGITRDITDRRQGEETLRQSEKLAAIGQLAGGIAHDFNNQLSVILGYAELLGSRLQDPELKHFSDAIAAAARNSGELTRNLLTFSRQGHFETVPIDFHELIDQVIHLLGHSIDKRITVNRRLRSDRSVIIGDPATLQNAILNLALNARDAMPDGGSLTFATGLLDITGNAPVATGPTDGPAVDPKAALPVGAYLHVQVEDTGTGMTSAVQKRIFEPFFTTKGVGKGTGMGLASVFGTVSVHHGKITVDSEPGRGTTFHLYLPLAGNHVDAGDWNEPVTTVGRALNILLVEDDRQIGALVEEMLKPNGHKVIKAEGGREALGIYLGAWREIDLILLDMVMPDMDGYATFHALRRINPSARVLLSSGFSPEGRIKLMLEDGVLGLLQKPYEKAQLDRMIAQAMA